MAGICRRIKELLKQRKLSAREVSLAAGLSADGIRNICRAEAAGRPYDPRSGTVEKVAKVLDVEADYLLHGTGARRGAKKIVDTFDPDRADDTARDEAAAAVERGDLVAIREIDVSAGAGGGGEVLVAYERQPDGSYIPAEAVKAEALFPRRWLNALGLDATFTDLVRVQGDSMSPEIEDGDWVFVDRRTYRMAADDIYLLWDGFGVVTKSLQLIRGSKPPRVRIISANKKYSIDELPLSEIRIIGRVPFRIGRIVRGSQ